jgi:hypothetical protein
MKASVFIIATLAGSLGLAGQAGAQSQGQSSGQTSADRVQLPAGGVTLSFTEIDRNNDRSISVEEWNDFVKTLHSRAGRADSSSTSTPGTISGGGTGATGSSEPSKGGEPRK